jgi:hypothetical protein
LAGPASAQPAAWQWGLQTINPTPADGSAAIGNGVATDAAGRVYVGGVLGDNTATPLATRSFVGAGTLGPGRCGFVAQASSAGQWAWVTAVLPVGTNSGGQSRATVTGVAVTAAGDVYASGTVEGASVQVGSQTQPLGSTGAALFVARLNSAGVCQWLQVVAMNSYAPGTLAADPSTGGVVVAGAYQGTPTFGSTTLPTCSFFGSGAVFVARLNAAGLWLGAAASTGTTGVETGMNVAVGPTGQVAVVSSQGAGTLTFGSNSLVVPATASQAMVVAQLSPTNQWQWAAGSSSGTVSSLFGVAYTPSGALWVTGFGSNGTQLGTLTMATPTGSQLSLAGVLAQLSSTGQWGTARQVSLLGSGIATLGPIAVDAAGNPIAMGILQGNSGTVQATLDGQTITAPASGSLFYLASLTSAGQWRYVAALPQPAIAGGISPSDIALDGTGSLYFTGGLRGGLTLGSSTLLGSTNSSPASSGTGDALLGKLINATVLAAYSAAAIPALACFPNPARTQATLLLPIATEASTVTLLDALGRPARTYPVPARTASTSLDLTGLAPGLYVVRYGAASGKLVVE